MLIYDTFREENEFHKKQFNNASAKITDKLFLAKFEATHKYSLYEDSSGNLHIKNNIKNNNDCVTIDKVILCLDDLSDIRQDTIGYITNFSVFKKHVNVLNRVYINNIMFHDILTIIRRFEIGIAGIFLSKVKEVSPINREITV